MAKTRARSTAACAGCAAGSRTDQERLDDVFNRVRAAPTARAMVSTPTVAAVIHRDGREIAPVHASRPAASTSNALSALSAMAAINRGGIGGRGKVSDPPQQPAGDARVPRARRAISLAPSGVMPI